MKKKYYRIVVNVSKKFHDELKERAEKEYMTIKGYVLRALVNQVWKNENDREKHD